MNVSLPQALPVLIPLLAAPLGWSAWTGVDRAADQLLAARAEERAVLACARSAAALRNLAAARDRLAADHPEYATRLALAAEDLEADLISPPPLLPPGVAGRCRSEGPRRLATSLHLERHPGQPDPWPNWIVRWEGSPP